MSSASSSRRRTWLLVGLAYATALVAAVLLFLGQRIYSRHATFSQRQFFWVGDVHENAPMGMRMGPHRTGFAVLNYGLHDPARRIAVHTDQLGCRVPVGVDSTVVVGGGLAAIGCSCTFAHGVAAESSYVSLAGEALGVPAYNLGVCGYSSVTSLLRLRELIGTLHPRWVVYGFGNFHLERSRRPRADFDLFQAYARVDDGTCRIVPPAFDNRLAFATASRIETLYNVPRLEGRETPFDMERFRVLLPLAVQDLQRVLNPKSVRLRFEHPALPDTLFCDFLLDQLLQTCRAENARLILLYFPAFYGERPDPGLVAAVDRLGHPADFRFVDCSPRLFEGVHDQQEYSSRWQVPRDGHPNRFMHAEMARAVVECISEDLSNLATQAGGGEAVRPSEDASRSLRTRPPGSTSPARTEPATGSPGSR